MPANDYMVVLKAFDDLTLNELYELLQLRSAVFVVEQQCIYQDMDDKDQDGYHLLMYNDAQLIGVTRLLPLGISYDHHCSIGRVVTHAAFRNQGLGRRLMQKSVAACTTLWPKYPIKISAQAHLEAFYASLGFASTGEAYLEDGIPHVAMTRECSVI